jgi:formamidopyrimidine-DNA glycosylase
MPEAPDLEVVREFLAERILGVKVASASVIKPSVLRPLAGGLEEDIPGRKFTDVQRRGKFLLMGLSGKRMLVINPMLTGALQYCPPAERMSKRTCISMALDNGMELRYRDDRQMGGVYYVTKAQLGDVPRLGEQGPDVLDDFTFEEFQQRLKQFHGEIKGVLTRGRVIAGIGNAYADEVLFAAKIYPFRKRKALGPEEMRALYEKSREVVENAIPVLRERMGEDIHVKIRDFLKVHNRDGEPCPDCGKRISQVTANRRITSYCRGCQPGLLIKN